MGEVTIPELFTAGWMLKQYEKKMNHSLLLPKRVKMISQPLSDLTTNKLDVEPRLNLCCNNYKAKTVGKKKDTSKTFFCHRLIFQITLKA